MQWTRKIRNWRVATGGALLTMVASLVPVVSVATPAQAATDCGDAWLSSGWRNGEGYGWVNRSHYLRQGPSSDCYNIKYVPAGTKVYYRCFHVNSYGNYWWRVRIAGTNIEGWTSENNLDYVWFDEDGDSLMWWANCTFASDDWYLGD